MATLNSIHEKGIFKEQIHSALYKNKAIVELLLGDTSGMTIKEVQGAFRDHVKSHLFIDDTIKETGTYIFYDVAFPRLESNIKECQVVLYAISHRDILDNYSLNGYHGNRTDILSELIIETLINDKEVSNSFGIGELTLDSVNIYNAVRFYGVALVMSIPNFW